MHGIHTCTCVCSLHKNVACWRETQCCPHTERNVLVQLGRNLIVNNCLCCGWLRLLVFKRNRQLHCHIRAVFDCRNTSKQIKEAILLDQCAQQVLHVNAVWSGGTLEQWVHLLLLERRQLLCAHQSNNHLLCVCHVIYCKCTVSICVTKYVARNARCFVAATAGGSGGN